MVGLIMVVVVLMMVVVEVVCLCLPQPLTSPFPQEPLFKLYLIMMNTVVVFVCVFLSPLPCRNPIFSS